MKPCAVGGCGEKRVHNNEDPVDVPLCAVHMGVWNASSEHDRATRIFDGDVCDAGDRRYAAAIADFARRIEAEERNAR